MALKEEKVAASSFRAFSSFLSLFMVSVTSDFSASYLLFRFAKAPSAVYRKRHTCKHTHTVHKDECLLITTRFEQ